MIKYLIRFFSLSFILFSLCSCQTTNFNQISTINQLESNPGLTYVAFTNKSNSTFTYSLQDLIIDYYPESNFISEVQSKLSPYLSNTYHCFFHTNNTGQKYYTIRIAINNSIPTEQLSLLASNFYQVKTQNNYLTISNTDQVYSIQNPDKNSILTIFSIDPNIFYNQNITDHKQSLSNISLQKLSTYLPVTIYEINNQIIINQIPEANINPDTQTIINYHPVDSEIFFKQKINNLLNSFHSNYYLSNDIFDNNNIDTISILLDQVEFKLIYKYQSIENATDVFEKISNSLSLQNSYLNKSVTLPDNTISTQFESDPANKISTTTDLYQITLTDIDAKNIIINQTDQLITITNSPENFQLNSYPNQIDFNNLIGIYPTLAKLNFIKSIQYYLNNNQLNGYIIK